MKEKKTSQWFAWRRSTLAWFFIDFLAGATAVLGAFLGMSLPIGVRSELPLPPWHPGAIPAALLFGTALATAYYAFGGEGKDWKRYSWQRNFIISLTSVSVALIIHVLLLYLFLLQMGRIILLVIFLLGLVVSFTVRQLAFSRIHIDRRSLLLITDEDHRPSPQMLGLIEGEFEVFQIDRGVLSKSSAEEWISEWQQVGIRDVVFVTRCESEMTEALLVECWKHGLRFVEWNFFVESNFRKLNVYDQHLDWLMHFGQQYAHPTYSKLKRGFDIVFSTVGIILSSPLLLIGMLLVYLDSGRPVFFRQERVGARDQVFTVWKLRTMVVVQDEDAPKWSSKGDRRITRVGKFLRRTRLDELPQLFHVLSGEMSLVGPRPEWVEIAREWEGRIPFYAYRTMVKPGLTGWAQINFSYAETKDEVLEKLSYDFYYIKHASMGLDMRIMLRTVSALLEGGR